MPGDGDRPADPQTQRREVHYRGRVQGVGFRYTARGLAAGFAVAGFVRNLADGRVELIVEGPAGEVAGFLSAIQSALGRYIRAAEQSVAAATGEFEGFEIR